MVARAPTSSPLGPAALAFLVAVAAWAAATAWAAPSPAGPVATPTAASPADAAEDAVAGDAAPGDGASADVPAADVPPEISLDLPPLPTTATVEPWLTTKMNGWVDSRTTGAYASVARLLPADDTPHLSNLTEANVQLKLAWREVASVYGDVSWVFARGGYYFGDDGSAGREPLDNHDVAAVRPGAFISELYTLLRFGDHWNLTLGKKRVVWGPGLAWNPTDLFNPPKDPTDPTQQRSGSWLARIEGQYDAFSLSFVGAAKTTQHYGGVPSGLLWYPDNLPAGYARDDEPHFVLGARAYALVADSDVQLFAFMSHLYNDAFRTKPRFGASFSRVLGDAFEVHGELLVQRGSSRLYFDADCTSDLGAAVACGAAGKSVASTRALDDAALRFKGLAGVRYQFGQAASVSAEYFFNTEGYDKAEFTGMASALALRKTATRQGLELPAGALGDLDGLGAGGADPGTPQKYAFEPLRRHYLFMTYMHPQLADDFTISAVVILGLEDLSGQLAPQLTWSARQWLNLSVGGFLALPGVASMGAQTTFGAVTETQLQPSLWRAYVAARAFF